jgi:acyl CoA:acetate/3-ketoacid CoA transferase alpha subunit
MNKVYPSAADALKGLVADGQLLAVGGFGLCGIPEALIAALRDSGVQGLTVISNNGGNHQRNVCQNGNSEHDIRGNKGIMHGA